MAAMDFYSTLEQLVNPTRDLSGGPGGSDSSRAIAQLILGGGSAAVEGQSLFGQPFETGPSAGSGNLIDAYGNKIELNPSAAPKPAAAPMRGGSFQAVLDNAKQMAEGLAPGSTAERKTLVANPYGPGSYDPNNPEERQAVLRAGEQAKKVAAARETLQGLAMSDIPKAAQGPIIQKILESIGLSQSEYAQAFDQAKGKAEGERAGGGGATGALSELDLRALAAGARPSPALVARGITTPQTANRILSGVAETKRGETALKNVDSYVNKKTGEWVNDPDISAEELQRDYKKLSKQQLVDKSSLDELSAQIAHYRRLANELGLVDIPEGTDLLGTAAQAARLKYGEFAGDEKVKDLLTVRGKISALAGAYGQDKRITESEYKMLQQTTLSNWDSKQGAERALNNMEQFIQNRSKSLGIPIRGLSNAERALDQSTAMQFLQQAGGDKDKARELARQQGYSF